jgi:PAS domain S-box-containing protein
VVAKEVERLIEALAAREAALEEARQELAEMQELYSRLYNLAPVGHLTIDEHGVVLQTNDLALELLGTTRNVLYGQPLGQHVARLDQKNYERFLQALFGSDTIQLDELQLRRSDGRMLYAELRGRRMAQGDGGAARGFIVVADVGERRKMHQALVRRNRDLAALNRFARAVSDAFDVADVTAQLEALFGHNADISAGAIFVQQPSQNHLRMVRRWGDRTIFEPFVGQPIDRQQLEATLSGENVLFLTRLREMAWLPWEMRDTLSTAHAAILAPMIARGDLEGVIWLFVIEKAGVSKERAAYLVTLAQQAAVAIRSARLFADVHQGQERLRLLTHQIVSAQEEERRRMARELHDETGQLLTALKFSLEMLGEDLSDAESYEQALAIGQKQLASAISLSEQTMAQIRGLVHNLRPTALDDLGLNSALEGLCHDFSKRGDIKVVYEHNIDEALVLPDSVQIVAYRFLQEALTNVGKHASASQVTVSVERTGQTIRLTVEDDGVGFDERLVGDGFGILGMRERLESVAGRLELSSRPREGARLVATIPVDD